MYPAASAISHRFRNMLRTFLFVIFRKCVMQVLDLAIAGMAGAGLGVKEEHVCPRC